MTLLGDEALWVAFLVGIWGTLTGIAGGRSDRADLARSARHAVFALCGALLVAVVSLEVALFRRDFNVEYVAAYTSRNLPTFYTWSALYAGQKGSLLFWATVLSLFGSLALVTAAPRHRPLLPYVSGIVSLVATFFVTVMLFAANPFDRLPYTPVDGGGLNPQLQNPGMVFHPPMLYLGYISITIPFAFAMAALLSVAGIVGLVASFFVRVFFSAANPFDRPPSPPAEGGGLNPHPQTRGMVSPPPMLYLGYISITIPFAFAMAALLSRRLDTDWLVAIRKWTLVSWLFLSIGLILGMWWAYVELGWGGYWAWDPVENAALLPWLTMTAFLHSVMIQEKRGMLRKWNLALVIGSWLLSIMGTFITRSGVISSVHSFTQSPAGYYFLAFLVLGAAASFTIYLRRLPLLEAEARLESMVSREASFLFNNLLLVGIAFSVLWGTLFPILSELGQGG